jgi:hypothetical protein
VQSQQRVRREEESICFPVKDHRFAIGTVN